MHDKAGERSEGAVAVVSATRSAAKARRRRMARRGVKKRVKKGAVLVGAFYLLAAIVAPSTLPKVEVPKVVVASLPSPLQWHKAAEVLARKPVDVRKRAAKPWANDTTTSVPRASFQRWHRIYVYASRYGITADLAGKVYDVAIRQGIEPELGFRVVNVESEFNPRAASPVGAIGLTQLMLSTARGFEPNVTRGDLMDPETNLRIGFKYLRALIRENKGNLALALLVYNRGPVAVEAALAMGLDPTNGYERMVTRGYRGRGTLD